MAKRRRCRAEEAQDSLVVSDQEQLKSEVHNARRFMARQTKFNGAL
jgi:hypothetical protein